MNSDFPQLPKLPGAGLFKVFFAVALLVILGMWGAYGWVAYQGVKAAKSCGGVPEAVVHTDPNGDKTYSLKCPDSKAPQAP